MEWLSACIPCPSFVSLVWNGLCSLPTDPKEASSLLYRFIKGGERPRHRPPWHRWYHYQSDTYVLTFEMLPECDVELCNTNLIPPTHKKTTTTQIQGGYEIVKKNRRRMLTTWLNIITLHILCIFASYRSAAAHVGPWYWVPIIVFCITFLYGILISFVGKHEDIKSCDVIEKWTSVKSVLLIMLE